MDLGLRGRIVLVTGANGSLGSAVVEALTSEGARVARSGLDSGYAADLLDPGQATALVTTVEKELGPIDGVVNTVGPLLRTDTPHLYGDDDVWRFHFDSVLMPTVRVCRAVLPLMKARGRGAVVNVAATSARHFDGQLAAYARPRMA